MRRIILKISRMPWREIVLFDVIAFSALALLLIAIWQTNPAHRLHLGAAQSNTKRIAISFDDMPRGPGAFLNVDQRPQMLIDALKQGGVTQAAFFVNPGRISTSNHGAASLLAYASAGHVIANHTATHKILSQVSAESFLADVDAATVVLKPLKNYRPWFRYPQLDEGGSDKAKRDIVRAGLKQRGLHDGYVTADGWDWFLDARVAEAARAGKTIDQTALRALYIETHVQSADFSDRLAMRVLGHRPVQMLLLHETDLAALYVGDLAKALRADGWEIVSADTAYADPLSLMRSDPDYANGTILEMLAWEKGLKGDRWFPRDNPAEARKLFTTRVLHIPDSAQE